MPAHVDENFEMIEVSHLTRDQAVDHLLILLKSENKIAQINKEASKKEDLKKLEIFDVWEKKNFREKFA